MALRQPGTRWNHVPKYANLPAKNRGYVSLAQAPPPAIEDDDSHYWDQFDPIDDIGEYELPSDPHNGDGGPSAFQQDCEAHAYYDEEIEDFNEQQQNEGYTSHEGDLYDTEEYYPNEQEQYPAAYTDDNDYDRYVKKYAAPPHLAAPLSSQPVSQQGLRGSSQVSVNQHGYESSAMSADLRSKSSIRLRPISHLPDLYRGIFKKFGTFNVVQSACYDDIMNTNGNLVISAPTGSGKTLLFELAIIRMHKMGSASKCVYIAPTKALCSEKYTDWSSKFEPLGLRCYELTGDTATLGRSLWSEAKKASIIVTTGEKWDSVTRGWNEHQELLSHVGLFLVDEVHVLGESRGSTLEVVVSRMKMRGNSVRFVFVSATIPNIDDIAAWISTPDRPARVLEFGEEYRPCKLERHVVGVGTRNKNTNSFQFSKLLDAKLFSVIQTYSVGKPILIFESTRKGVFNTAELLVKAFTEVEKSRARTPWTRPSRIEAFFKDKRLGEFAAVGVGVHHAGLDMEDRKTIERLYIEKVLRVLVATSTLAVGVNLPAHFVIIKGVYLWQNGQNVEYSDLDITQMMGRAGRPQFDTEGIAVVMCENELVRKYEDLSRGTKVLESCLHLNLSEHINSEIGMGTISDLETAKQWLRGSFFYQRVRKNPNYYAIGEVNPEQQDLSWQERIDELVLASIRNLEENQLVEKRKESQQEELVSTEYGEIMSKFYLRQGTMAEILKAPKNATLRDLLEIMCKSEEFSETNKLRQTEKSVCNQIRKNPDMRFEIKRVETTADKVFVLIQAVLGGISLNDPEYKAPDCQLFLEVMSIFKHVTRLSRAIAEVGIAKKDAKLVKHGLELVRCLNAKAWEDRPVVLRQIESLGDKSIKILAEHGITSLAKLRKTDPMRVEALLRRNSGFGLKILDCVKAMPQYFLKVEEIDVRSSSGKGPVEVEVSITVGLTNAEGYGALSKERRSSKQTYDVTSILTMSSDSDFIDYRRIQTKVFRNGAKDFTVTAHLTKPSQSIVIIAASDNFAGCTVEEVYKPKVPASEFPVPQTKPLTSTELDLEGLENDPDFWNMTMDSGDEEPKPKPQSPGPRQTQGMSSMQDVTRPEKSDARAKTRDEGAQSPRRLANGNYPCNHTCGDKTKCRHFCCRNGVPDPPKKPKEKSGSANSREKDPAGTNGTKRGSKVQRLHTTTKGTSVSVRDEQAMADMEKRHSKAGVAQNLGLTAGKRIKLDPTLSTGRPDSASSSSLSALLGSKAKLKKKEKPPPNYDISFADLGEANIPTSDNLYGSDIVLSDGDDESIVTGLLLAGNKAKPKEKANTKGGTKSTKPSSTQSTATTTTIGLKRTVSTISLTDSSDDDARPSKKPATPVTSKATKVTRTPASPRVERNERSPETPGSQPLFIPSDPCSHSGDTSFPFNPVPDDFSNASFLRDEEASSAPTANAEADTMSLADDILAFFASQPEAVEDAPQDGLLSKQTYPFSAPPESSNTLRTQDTDMDRGEEKSEEHTGLEFDDFADLEAWL